MKLVITQMFWQAAVAPGPDSSPCCLLHKQMAFQDYFSLIAFFIFLRETLEASVIIAVLLQCMNRTSPRLKKQGELLKSCHS